MLDEVDFNTLKDHAPYGQYEVVDVVFGDAYVDTEVLHHLNPATPEHIDYQVIRRGQAGVVYHDMSATRKPWRDGAITLRSNIAGARVTLLLSISHKPRTLLDTTPPSVTPAVLAHTHSAADIISGTLADARLSANVPLLNLDNVFTGNQKIDKTRPRFDFRHSGNALGHMGMSAASDMFSTSNLTFDGTNWNLDDTALGGTVVIHDASEFNFYKATSGSNPRTLSKIFRIDANGALYERGRTVAIGDWAAVTHSGGNFTASSGTWTVASGDQILFRYSLVGSILYIRFRIDTSSVSATPLSLRIALPLGLTVAQSSYSGDLVYNDNNTGWNGGGQIHATAGNAYIDLYKRDQSTWATATDTTYAWGRTIVEV